jgi:ABC-type multidrug transport system ATPase subunit
MELVIEGVGKRYKGDFWGLRGFSLRLAPGVLGLLGPNGAGKSTLMRILATITKPTEGRVLWNGEDIARTPDGLRSVLGYLPQDFGVYPNLTAVEFLEYLAAVKGLDGKVARRRIEELLALVNLTDARKKPLGGYSGGMKQRIGIAQALLNDPRLLIVDEPTVGLDPEERVLPSADLPGARERWKISNTVRRADGVHARVVSPVPPAAAAAPLAPTLEDAYLAVLEGSRGRAAAAGAPGMREVA